MRQTLHTMFFFRRCRDEDGAKIRPALTNKKSTEAKNYCEKQYVNTEIFRKQSNEILNFQVLSGLDGGENAAQLPGALVPDTGKSREAIVFRWKSPFYSPLHSGAASFLILFFPSIFLLCRGFGYTLRNWPLEFLLLQWMIAGHVGEILDQNAEMSAIGR